MQPGANKVLYNSITILFIGYVCYIHCLNDFLTSTVIFGPFSLGFGGMWSFCILLKRFWLWFQFLGDLTVIDDRLLQFVPVYPYSSIIGVDYPSEDHLFDFYTCTLTVPKKVRYSEMSCVLRGYTRTRVRVGLVTTMDVVKCIRTMPYLLQYTHQMNLKLFRVDSWNVMQWKT